MAISINPLTLWGKHAMAKCFFLSDWYGPGSLDESWVRTQELQNYTWHGRGNLHFWPDSAADLHPRLWWQPYRALWAWCEDVWREKHDWALTTGVLESDHLCSFHFGWFHDFTPQTTHTPTVVDCMSKLRRGSRRMNWSNEASAIQWI